MAILLVDDEPRFTDVVARNLEKKEEWEILTATSGAEALDILEARGDVEILATDFHMPPGMDGAELINRALAFQPDLYTIVFTGWPDREFPIRALRAHADDFIEKGSDIDDELHRSIQKGFQQLALTRSEPDRHNSSIRSSLEFLVKMAIETSEGKEEIEKTLEEHGLLVRGKMTVEEFLADPVQIRELQNELKHVYARLDEKDERIADQQATIGGLLEALASASALSQQTFHHLVSLKANIQEAVEVLPEKERYQLRVASAELMELDADSDKKEAGSALSKVRPLVEELEDEESTLAKFLKRTHKGVQIAESIARLYNTIAQWCGPLVD